jgi:transcription elongation factor Elf1
MEIQVDWLDRKYIGFIAHRLRNYKQKSQNLYNFSCPICGDSKADKRKARAYFYEKKGKAWMCCHNCGVGMEASKLVKHLDQGLYNEYIKERMLANGQERRKTDVELFAEKMKKPKFMKTSPLMKLKKVSLLNPSGPTRMYVDGRQIPTSMHHKLFYCKHFKAWVNSFLPNKFENENNDEARLIIPFIDQDGEFFGFQGRSLAAESNLRYITIILDEDQPKLYGLDTVKLDQTIYVVEGPIDSMFIPNAIASAGSDLISNLRVLSTDKSKFVIVFDNEPRNKEIVKKIEKTIDQGYSVCLWPDIIVQKDINDMVLAGLTPKKIVDIINENTYSGLSAKMQFNIWKKI